MTYDMNSVITFKSGIRYLVLATAEFDAEKYLYLTKIAASTDDIEGENRILKEVSENGTTKLAVVTGFELDKAKEKMEEIFNTI